MAYHHKITADKIRENLQKRIDEISSELKALQGVKINTSHKTLTNRAISGNGARIGDYLSINKALYVSYSIKYQDGHTRYSSRTITAYSYEDEQGGEIGVDGFTRISRTIKPSELDKLLTDIMDGLKSTINNLKKEYKRADAIALKQNKLVDMIDKFNKNLSCASEAQI